MAAALDTSAQGVATGFAVGPRTVTYSHTCTGSNLILVVWVAIWQDTAGTGSVTAITYNGVSLTNAIPSNRSTSMASEMWYLIAPATGANTLSVTVTGATDGIRVASASFTGVLQVSPLGVTATNPSTAGNPAISITSGTANSVLVAGLCRFGNTAITATTWNNLQRANANSVTMVMDYLITTTAGSQTATETGSAAQDWIMMAAEFKPATGGPTVNKGAAFLMALSP
jgi:hypothetical protein